MYAFVRTPPLLRTGSDGWNEAERWNDPCRSEHARYKPLSTNLFARPETRLASPVATPGVDIVTRCRHCHPERSRASLIGGV